MVWESTILVNINIYESIYVFSSICKCDVSLGKGILDLATVLDLESRSEYRPYRTWDGCVEESVSICSIFEIRLRLEEGAVK
jgi:hypothetical protein